MMTTTIVSVNAIAVDELLLIACLLYGAGPKLGFLSSNETLVVRSLGIASLSRLTHPFNFHHQ
jgi:hypothetical protein